MQFLHFSSYSEVFVPTSFLLSFQGQGVSYSVAVERISNMKDVQISLITLPAL